MFEKMPITGNNLDAKKTKSKNGVIEKKFEKSSSDKIFDILSENYIDQEGNLIGWQEFEYNDNPHQKNLRKLLDRIGEADLEEFLYKTKNLEILISHINKSDSILEKIKLIKIMGDVAESVIKDNAESEKDSFGFIEKSKEALKSIISNEKVSYFVRSFAKTIYSRNLELENWYTDDFEESNQIERRGKILEMHESQFDDFLFEFTPDMINKLNYESRDYGSLNEMTNGYDALPMKKIRECPYFNGDHEHFFYNGDYLTSTIAPGILGIFSKNGTLIGWQNKKFLKKEEMSSLNSPLNIRGQILSGDQKKYFPLFKVLLSLSFKNKIKNELGINLKEYSLRTQYQFLQFIKNYKKTEIDKVKKFIEKSSTKKEFRDKIKSFLSLEIDQNSGDKILEIGKKLKPNQAHFVFSKISQLADLADQENEEIVQVIFKESKNKSAPNIQLTLLQKAHQIISDFSQAIKNKNSVNDEEIGKLLENLEKTKIEIEFLAEVLKNLPPEEKKDSLEIIKNLDLQQKAMADLTEEEKEQILENARKNWQKDNPDVADEIVDHLEKELNPQSEKEKETAQQTNSCILKYQNEIIGFIKFKPVSENEVYAGSLNITQTLRGEDIGKQFLEKSLEKESQEKIILAETSLRNPATKCYIEKFNFAVDGIISDSYGKNHPFFTIRIDKNLNENLKTKNSEKYSLEKIKNLFQEQENSGLELKELIKEKDIIIQKLDKNPQVKGCPDEEELKKVSQMILLEKDDDGNLVQDKEQKFIGTRYLYDKKEKQWYVVFERIN